jgi:two-component system phosphate regulon response regulator PhoB
MQADRVPMSPAPRTASGGGSRSPAASAKPCILIVDDEADVLNLVGANLRGAGFEVLTAEDGNTALELDNSRAPALIILDVMLPGLSGTEVCKALKASPRTAGIPVIMLTAKAEEVDRVLGFHHGAADYVTKPFSPRELVLRVRNILRPASAAALPREELVVGDLKLTISSPGLLVKGVPVDVTVTEFRILKALMERSGRVQTRDVLLNAVWGSGSAISARAVDTHMRRLREKLGAAAAQIETIRGFGYRLREEI